MDKVGLIVELDRELSMGDRQDNHLINASMRCMMAYCVDRGEI